LPSSESLKHDHFDGAVDAEIGKLELAVDHRAKSAILWGGGLLATDA